MPPSADPSLRNGKALTAASRSHAQALFEAGQEAKPTDRCIHTVLDITDTTQVIAIVDNTCITFDEELARKGAAMLFQTGHVLEQSLLEAGLLEDVVCADHVRRIVTHTPKVNDTFLRIAYVIVSQETTIFNNCRHGPICTCRWFCRYAGCEHTEFVRSIGLRLLPADYALMTVPGSMPRGRPSNVRKVTAKPETLGERKHVSEDDHARKSIKVISTLRE